MKKRLLTLQEFFDKHPTREERTANVNLNEECEYMGMLKEKAMTHKTKSGGTDRETRIPRALNAKDKGHNLPNSKEKVMINGVAHKVETGHACKGECFNSNHMYTCTQRENTEDRVFGFSKIARGYGTI